MIKAFRWFLLIMSLGFFGITQGLVISSLYTSEVPVKSQSSEDRLVAFREGLTAVLIKVSGNTHVTEVFGLNEAIQNPTQYVQTFSYIAGSSNSQESKLILKFNKQSIDDLLKHNDQPIWGQDRPLVLVWLLEKKNNGVEIPNLSHETDLNLVLMNQANFRGVTWLFPLLDMIDLQQINSNTIWNEPIDVFKLISKRYAPDEILIIHLDSTQPSLVRARFSLIFPDKVSNWIEEGENRLLVLQKGLGSTVDYLASHFVEVQPQVGSNTIILRIENLKNIEDYAKLMRYLHDLTGVESVDVSNISFPVIEVRLSLTVSVETLKRTIQLNSLLQPSNSSDHTLQSDQEFLTYQFHSI